MAAVAKSELFWSEKLQEIEALVVAGKHVEARQSLSLIKPKTIPREWAAPYSQLALRFRDSLQALKILHPIIRPENTFNAPASAQETVAYAYALTNLGAVDESLEMLTKVNAEDEPEVLFQKSIALFKKWNYEDAAPFLVEFIQSDKITYYRRLVGKINLAAALVCLEKWEAAQALLIEIEQICKANKYNFLLGNCYELQAQVHLFSQRYDLAFVCIRQSLNFLENENGIYSLLARKWEAIGLCLSSPNESSLNKLREIRLQAKSLSHWETMRECDLFEAKFTNNAELFQKVIMGTPSESYRQRARKLFGSTLRAVGHYEFSISGALSDEVIEKHFDPYKKNSQGFGLYERPYLLYLFEALTQDFYKPSHLGLLFRSLYPEEKFNPYTSPARVLRLLKNLDKWFLKAKVPLRVKFKSSEFQIISQQSISVIVRRGIEKSPEDAHLFVLKQKFGDKPFSSGLVASSLGISKTTALKLLKQASKNGKLKFFAQGRESRYQFSKSKKSISRAA